MKHFSNNWFWPVLCGLLLAFGIIQYQHARVSAPDQQNAYFTSFADAVSLAAPSVVNIYTSKRKNSSATIPSESYYPPFSDKQNTQQSLGSGVIISNEGFILTNNHVIKGADEILVLLSDGRDSLAQVVGTDPESDLAVLKITLPRLNPIKIADTKQSRVGDIVLAIGNPFGFEQTVTQGIISALGRYGLRINTYENFIQTDAAINPGNSGGALIDVHGNLLGINSAIYSKSGGSEGIGLAIPVDTALKVLRDIIQYGRVIRGWLGIEAKQLAPQQAEALQLPFAGVIVTGTYPGGPADLAGIIPGDIIMLIDQQPITDGYTGMNEVANIRPGSEITIDFIRDSLHLQTKVKTGIRPSKAR
jgi:serine protease DegS